MEIKRPDFFDLILLFESSQFTDPRDIVYGLRALAEDGHTLPVDYTKGPFHLLIFVVSRQNFKSFRSWSAAEVVSKDRRML
jgi:hypothetical protein